MANSGPNSNNSQFFICLKPQERLNGKHVVFGEVIQGLNILDMLESVGSQTGAT